METGCGAVQQGDFIKYLCHVFCWRGNRHAIYRHSVLLRQQYAASIRGAALENYEFNTGMHKTKVMVIN